MSINKAGITIVPQEEMYSRLKDFTWIFRDVEVDLYSTVDIDDNDDLIFEVNKMQFVLSNFRIAGIKAKIDAESQGGGDTATSFTFTGTRKTGE